MQVSINECQTKIQQIIKSIHELAEAGYASELHKIIDHCKTLQNSDISTRKTLYLKQELKSFMVYPELENIINGINVINLKENIKEHIERCGEEKYYKYDIKINDLMDLRYEYSFTYDNSSTVLYKQCDDIYWSECYSFGVNVEEIESDFSINHSIDPMYECLGLKNLDKEIFKKFLLLFFDRLKIDI